MTGRLRVWMVGWLKEGYPRKMPVWLIEGHSSMGPFLTGRDGIYPHSAVAEAVALPGD